MTFEQCLERYDGTTYSNPTDGLRDLWNAAQAQCAAGPWQPIDWENPPTKGSLLKLENGGRTIGFWNATLRWWMDCITGERLECDPTHFAELREVPK